jgi:hypothetical protein
MPPKTFEEGKAKAAEKQNRNIAKAEIFKAISRYIPNFDFKTNKLPPATKKGMKEKYDTFYNTILKPAIDSNQNDPYIIKLLRTFISEMIPQESKEREVKEPEVKAPEPQPQAVEAPAVPQPTADDILSTNDLTSFLVNQERKNKLQAAMDKGFALSESRNAMNRLKSFTAEKKSQAKISARKAIAEKLKQDIKRLKEEAKIEAKSRARGIVANRRGMGSEDINRAPQEKKREFRIGASDILRAQSATVPPVATASPAIAPPERKVATTNLAQLVATQSNALEQKIRIPRQPIMTRQQTPEQFLQENLDEFVEAGKEREVKEQPLTTGQSFTNRMLDAIGSLTFSGLFAVLSTYAARTNNKDLSKYIAPLGGALGGLVYRKVSDFKDGASEILDKVSKLGGSPDDIIRVAKRASRPNIRPEDDEPPAPTGRPSEPPPQRPLPPKPRVRMSDKDMNDMINEALTRERPIDSMVDKRPVSQVVKDLAKDTGRGAYSIASGIGTSSRGVVEGVQRNLEQNILRNVADSVYRQTIGYNEGFNRNVDRGQFQADRKEEVLLSGPDPIGDRNLDYTGDGDYPLPEGFADARDYDGSRPSRIREAIERAGRVSQNVLTAGGGALIGEGVTQLGTAVGSGIATAVTPPATGAGPETKTDVRPTINESPIILKNDELNQDQVQNIEEGKKKDEIRRGAGILKPKFIVPSVNIFNKTEQEQYVDDIEFAMFDFVQDDSGGNDPTGTNPILRDQTLSQGLRYQRSGVTVNSLYGKNLPDNPKNMTQAMLAELFLGEPLLPTMKFLFSEEFNVQEFNQSEFEVNNYDVNNELTAIEAFSPYANFTNNQLLDQFIDTSILYGVVP